MEDAVEAVLVAVRIDMHIPPGAAIAHLEAVDPHGHLARPKPLHHQLRVGPGAEEEVARGVKRALDDDLRDTGLGDDPGCVHAVHLSKPCSKRSVSWVPLE